MSRLLAITLSVVVSFCGVTMVSGAAGEPDLAGHPLYSGYQFGRNEQVVDMATQPLAVPIGVIGEVMSHDRTLRRALQERGWRFRSHPFLKGSDSNFFFRRGDLDLAVSGDWPTITLAATHDIVVVGLAKQGFSSVIAREFFRIEELKGRRIAVPLGSTAHYGLLVALAAVGIKEADITIVPLEVNGMIDALARDKIDAFAAWDPVTSNALRIHPEFRAVQRFLNNSYFYFSAAFMRENPEVAELLLASYLRGLRWLREDRQNLLRAVDWTIKAGERMLGKPTGLVPEDLAKITVDDLLKIIPAPTVPVQDFAKNGSIYRAFIFLQGHGKIPANIPWGRVAGSIDRTLINTVLDNSEKYRLRQFDYED